jgi:hypothetical protein
MCQPEKAEAFSDVQKGMTFAKFITIIFGRFFQKVFIIWTSKY